MLVHNVYFWLKDDLTDDQRSEFKAAIKSLCDIPAARSVYVGQPAKTVARPVMDTSFSFALTVIFDDLAGHDAYQVHELHTSFVENYSSMWTKVLIYDSQ